VVGIGRGGHELKRIFAQILDWRIDIVTAAADMLDAFTLVFSSLVIFAILVNCAPYRHVCATTAKIV